jgi:hypothetical protein
MIREEHLEKSIGKRMRLYKQYSKGKPIAAYINIGGGIASLGNSINGKLIPVGLTTHLPMQNFPLRGVIIQMGQKGVPIIHLLNINQLLSKFGLPISPVPLPEPGTGEIFVQKKYSMLVSSIATVFLVIVIIIVYLSERKHLGLGQDMVYQNENKNDDREDIPVL